MKLACCVLASVLLLVSPGILASPEDGAELKLYEVLRGMDAPIRTIHDQVMDSDQVEEQFQELVTTGQGGDTDALIAAACLTSNIWFAEQAGAKGRSTAQDARAFELMAEAADRGSATALTYLAVYYAYGIGVERNVDLSMQLLRRAAAAGSLRARRLYVAALKNEELDKRVLEDDFLPALQAFAVEGDPWALGALGLHLSSGVYDGDLSTLSEAVSYLNKGWRAGNAGSAQMFAVLLEKEGYKSFNKEEGAEAFSQYVFFQKYYDQSDPETELRFARYVLLPYPYTDIEYYQYPFRLLTDLEKRTDLSQQLQMEVFIALYAYHTRIGAARGSLESGQEAAKYIDKAWGLAKDIAPDEQIAGAIAMQHAINLMVGLSAEPDFDSALAVVKQAKNTGLPDLTLIEKFLEDEMSVEQALGSCTYSCPFWEIVRKYEIDYEAALAEEEKQSMAAAQARTNSQSTVAAPPLVQKSSGGFKRFLKGVFIVVGVVLLIGAAVLVGGAMIDSGVDFGAAEYAPPPASAYYSTAPSTYSSTPPTTLRSPAPVPFTSNPNRSSGPRQYNSYATGCISDVSCGSGNICLKKAHMMSGVCVGSASELGGKTYNSPRPQSFEVGSGLPRCTSIADCPIGFKCDVTYGVCMR